MFDGVKKQLGSVRNLFRLFAKSAAALEAYLGMSAGLTKALDLRTRERIAVAVALVNGCNCCLSAHTYIGLNLAKIAANEIALNRQGASGDANANAAVHFAVQVVQARGKVSDAGLAAVHATGYSEAEVVEMVPVVAENVLTNFINNVAEPDIDFPVVHTSQSARPVTADDG